MLATGISEQAQKVRDALIHAGLESPISFEYAHLSSLEKKRKISAHLKEILMLLGVDAQAEHLKETPMRVSKMWVDETFSGLDYANFPSLAFSRCLPQQLPWIATHGIEVLSQCAHHMVVIDGHASVAYVPKDKLIGLSKLNRLVRFFSRRPQLQELLTAQCLVALKTVLETEDVAVRITATHYCVRSRGVRDVNTKTTTMQFSGAFLNNPHWQQAVLDT